MWQNDFRGFLVDEELLTNMYLLYGILILKVQRVQTPTILFLNLVILFVKGL